MGLQPGDDGGTGTKACWETVGLADEGECTCWEGSLCSRTWKAAVFGRDQAGVQFIYLLGTLFGRIVTDYSTAKHRHGMLRPT